MPRGPGGDLRRRSGSARRLLLLLLAVALSLPALACGPRRTARRYGIYHTVAAGETLYRIALAYGADVDRLRRVNRLRDPDRLEIGQKVFVPGARWPREVGRPPAPERDDDTAAEAPADSPRGAPAPSSGRVSTATRPAASPPDRLPVRIVRPCQGVVSSGFGDRDGLPHTGIDIRAPEGTPVGAAAPGTAKWTGEVRGYGRTVILDHGADVATVYAHLSEILVEPGDEVGATVPIGRVGTTGRVTGAHLHFEVRLDGEAVDPLRYLP